MSAVSSIAGGLVSGVSNLIGGQATNAAAADQASDAEAFSERMSDTQFQRGTADMRAAGLNPILAAGSPDSSPSGVAAPVVNSLSDAMQHGIGNFSALQSARQADAGVDSTNSTTNLNNALSAKAAADTTVAMAEADKIKSGSIYSSVVGSDLAAKSSQFLNSAIDDAAVKVSDIISHINVNSAKKVSPPPSPAHFNYDSSSNGVDRYSSSPLN